MTRFVAAQLAKSHYFSIDAARREFGYEPTVTIEAGLRNLIDSLNGDRREPTAMGPARTQAEVRV